MKFRKLSLALVALGVTVSLAACEYEETAAKKDGSVKLTKAEKREIGKINKGEIKAHPEDEEVLTNMAQQNALESGNSYLDTGAFSRSGLIQQLKFEGFSKADATYAVDAIDPNWNQQAAKSAKSYLDTSSFSASGLQEQLEFEGFTQAQAAYGVDKAGY
jgi:colicin import membrane protein